MNIWRYYIYGLWVALWLFACAVDLCPNEDPASSNELESLFGKEGWQRVQDLVSRGYAIKDQQGYYPDQDELLKCFLSLREELQGRGWSMFTGLQELARREWAKGIVDDLLLEFADNLLPGGIYDSAGSLLDGDIYDKAVKLYEKILSDHTDGVPCVEWLKFPDRYDSEAKWPEDVASICLDVFTRYYATEKVEDPGRTIDLARSGKAIALLKSRRYTEVIRLMDAFLELGESPPRAFGGDYPPVVEAYFYKAIALKELGATDSDIYALRDEMLSKRLHKYLHLSSSLHLGRQRLRAPAVGFKRHLPQVPRELMLVADDETTDKP